MEAEVYQEYLKDVGAKERAEVAKKRHESEVKVQFVE